MNEIILKNDESRARVSLFGGMTAIEVPLGGRTLSPLYENPWGEAPGDPFLTHLHGAFFCLPFGIAPDEPIPGWPAGGAQTEKEYAHGYSANGVYETVSVQDSQALLRLSYDSADVDRVERRVILRETGVDFEDTVYPKRDFTAPVGFHPIFRLPEKAGGCRLLPPECAQWVTYPKAVDDTSIFEQNAAFSSLERVPLKDGKTMDASALPLVPDTEELLLALNVSQGLFRLAYPDEGYMALLKWDKAQMAHCMLWMSNRGRKFAPWSGRNLCLGIEPVTSAFDLGRGISAAGNPLSGAGYPTSFAFTAGRKETFRHSIDVLPL